MNYNNTIYLVDNIIYFKNQNSILEFNFPKDIVYELNKEMFIKKYLSYLKTYHLSRILFYQKITIIYDSKLSRNDLNYLKSLFYQIGYHKVILKSDLSYLKISKKTLYLLIGKDYKIIYRDSYNQIKHITINKDTIPFKDINNMIQKRIKKDLFIIGQYDNKILYDNYYLIEDKPQFFLKN